MPSTRVILSGRDRDNGLLFAISQLHTFTAILRQARYLGGSRRRQVERVRCHEIESSPLSNFSCPPRLRPAPRFLRLGRSGKILVEILVLTGVVHRRADIEAGEPRV